MVAEYLCEIFGELHDMPGVLELILYVDTYCTEVQVESVVTVVDEEGCWPKVTILGWSQYERVFASRHHVNEFEILCTIDKSAGKLIQIEAGKEEMLAQSQAALYLKVIDDIQVFSDQ